MCSHLHIFSLWKKNWSLFLIHQRDWSQSKCYDDLAYSHSYRNVQEKVSDFTTKMEIFGANSVHMRKLCSEFGQIFMGCASLNAHNLWAGTHQSSWEGFLCFRLERGRSQFWEEIHLSSYAITHQSCEEKCPKTNTIRSTLHLYWLKEDHAPPKPVKF